MNFVFVYGSLLSGYWNHERFLAENPDAYLAGGADATALYLVDLGSFPGAHRGTRRDFVVGEVYAVGDATLRRLDGLEGHPSMYRRERVWVRPNGIEHADDAARVFPGCALTHDESYRPLVEVWTYIYQSSPEGRVRIPPSARGGVSWHSWKSDDMMTRVAARAAVIASLSDDPDDAVDEDAVDDDPGAEDDPCDPDAWFCGACGADNDGDADECACGAHRFDGQEVA